MIDSCDRRRPVFRAIWEAAARLKVPGRALVVGINGVDCSGKTMFTARLDAYLKRHGVATQLVNVDDFHQPRRLRHAAPDERYYDQVKKGLVFDFPRIIDELLEPVRRGMEVSKTLALLDWRTDEMSVRKEFNIGQNTVVVLEGVYLFTKQIAGYVDFKVFLDIPEEVWRERARARDPAEVFARYETRYLPAQRRYMAEFPPYRTADIIVDNADWDNPRVVFSQK